MADSNLEAAPEGAAGAADAAAAKTQAAKDGAKGGKSGGGPLLVIAAVVSLIAGAALGALVIGPKLVGPRGPRAAVASTETPPPAEGKIDPKAKPVLFKIDNIIVNPAGAQGSHFLMASIAFEVPDDRVETRLRDHEVQVRDVVISTLERQSMDTLVQPGIRETLKKDLTDAVTPIAQPTAWIHCYLPQFVIQ